MPRKQQQGRAPPSHQAHRPRASPHAEEELIRQRGMVRSQPVSASFNGRTGSRSQTRGGLGALNSEGHWSLNDCVNELHLRRLHNMDDCTGSSRWSGAGAAVAAKVVAGVDTYSFTCAGAACSTSKSVYGRSWSKVSLRGMNEGRGRTSVS